MSNLKQIEYENRQKSINFNKLIYTVDIDTIEDQYDLNAILENLTRIH